MKQLLFTAIFFVPLIQASKSPIPYSQYQIDAWILGGAEGFEEKWYPDGKTKSGVQKYSIGHGYNDWGTPKRRWKIASYLKDGLTYKESIEICRNELNSYKPDHTDQYVIMAFRHHAYNVGPVKTIKELRGCHGAAIGCGHKDKNVRKAHSIRRKLEYALATHDFETALPIIEMFRDICSKNRSMSSKPRPNETNKQKPVKKLPDDGPDLLWGLF